MYKLQNYETILEFESGEKKAVIFAEETAFFSVSWVGNEMSVSCELQKEWTMTLSKWREGTITLFGLSFTGFIPFTSPSLLKSPYWIFALAVRNAELSLMCLQIIDILYFICSLVFDWWRNWPSCWASTVLTSQWKNLPTELPQDKFKNQY